MTKPPVPSAHNTTSDHLDCQTWILRVYIHCEGCKKKVFKVLQSIDGVYKTAIDSQQHKVIVTGSVDGDTLVQKLLKSGKHAQVLPESFQAADANSKKKKKKKQNDKIDKDGGTTGNDDNDQVEDEKEKSDVTISDGNDQEIAEAAVAGGDGDGDGGGKKKKKKKKKGDKNGDTKGNPAADTGGIVNTENVSPHPAGHENQMVYGTATATAIPYDLQPPYQNYYPTQGYGMSYSTFYPSSGTESSYYTPRPVYGYAQSHPSVYYPPPPPPPPPPSYHRSRSAFDDSQNENENENGRACTIM